MENEESLQSRASIGKTSKTVENGVDQLLSDSVVTPGVVGSGIFLSAHESLGVEERSISSSTDFINHSGLEIDVDGSGNVFSLVGVRMEEKLETVERVRVERLGGSGITVNDGLAVDETAEQIQYEYGQTEDEER